MVPSFRRTARVLGNPRIQRYLVAALSGAAMAFSMPGWGLWWLAWLAMAPLFAVVAASGRAREAFFLAWTHAFVFFLVSTQWLTHTLTVYGSIPLPLSYLLYSALAAVLAAFAGFACASLRWLPRAPAWASGLSAGLVWVAWEYFRTVHFNGFPWNLIGYSQHPNLAVLQAVEFTGIYGMSFLVVAVGAALGRGWWEWRGGRGWRPGAAALAAPLALVAAAWGFGHWRLANLARPAGPGLRVAMAQGNIDQLQKWSPQYQRATLEIYDRLTRRAAAEGIDLMIWPETAAPFFFQSPTPLRARIERTARNAGVPLLFGAPAFVMRGEPKGALQRFERSITDRFSPEATERYLLRNRAYLLDANGRELGHYAKMHLVPFGEYNPIPFVRQLVEAAGNFTPGERAHTLKLDGHEIGVLICYEGVQPDLPRTLVREGASFLVNMTNDAWFGPTVAPRQHLVQEAVRAAENKVPMVRAANTGISAVIAPSGEILAETPLYEEALLRWEIHPRAGGTFYSRHGNLFAWGAVIYYGAVIAWRYRRLLADPSARRSAPARA